MTRMTAELDQLLAAQGGVVTTAQARSLLTRRDLEHYVDLGVLHRLWTSIYSRDKPTTLLRLRGLDLLTGTTVAACLGTAAAAYGFDTEQSTDLHVLNPEGRQLRSTHGLIVHRRDGAPLRTVAGRPLTTPAWTAIELARALRRPRALATLDAALRSTRCNRSALVRAAELQAGRRGIVAARELLALASPLAESPMESEARLVMHDGGLPTPVLQYELLDLTGRLWRLDYAWPEYRVAAQYDGVDWHTSPDAFRRDRIRTAALQDLHWVVVPIIAADVRRQPAQLVRRLESRIELARVAA